MFSVKELPSKWAFASVFSKADSIAVRVVAESDYDPSCNEQDVQLWTLEEGTLIAEPKPDHGECPAIVSTVSVDTEEAR